MKQCRWPCQCHVGPVDSKANRCFYPSPSGNPVPVVLVLMEERSGPDTSWILKPAAVVECCSLCGMHYVDTEDVCTCAGLPPILCSSEWPIPQWPCSCIHRRCAEHFLITITQSKFAQSETCKSSAMLLHLWTGCSLVMGVCVAVSWTTVCSQAMIMKTFSVLVWPQWPD